MNPAVERARGRIKAWLENFDDEADLAVIEAMIAELPSSRLAAKLRGECVAAVEPAFTNGRPTKDTRGPTHKDTVARVELLSCIRAFRVSLGLPEIPRPGVHVHLKERAQWAPLRQRFGGVK